MSLQFVQAQSFTLAGSGASIGDTSIVLNSFTQIDGTLLTMADFGTIGFGTIEPNNRDFEEQICWTGVTQNANGTATLTGVSTVLNVSPYTQTSGLATSHAGGVIFVITNTAGFYDHFLIEDNDETITGLWTFVQFPLKSGSLTPTAGAQFATKDYVDTAGGGPTSYDQMVLGETAGETIAVNETVYFKESDQRWWKTDADALATSQNVKIGIATTTGTAGLPVSVLVMGRQTGMSGLTAGAKYYLSNTAGGVSTTPGTLARFIGWAESTTVLMFFPDDLPEGIIFDTVGENVSAGNLVYFKTSDQKWWKTDADAAATAIGVDLGIVQATALADAIGLIRVSGIDNSNTGLTAGARYFVSGTAGAIVATTPGTFQRFVGFALSTQELLLGSDPFVLTQDGQQTYAADAQANDTYVITRVPAPAALKTGMTVLVKFNTANTGTATLNDTGLGAVTIVKLNSTTLADGDIAASSIHLLVYDGTNYRMLTPTSNAPTDSLFCKKLTEIGNTSLTNINATPQNVFSVTVPGGTLSTNNAIYGEIKYQAVVGTAINTLTAKLVYGSTGVSSGVLVGFTGTSTSNGVLEFLIAADGATNDQHGWIRSVAAATESASTPVANSVVQTAGNLAEVSTGDLTLKLTIESDGPGAGSLGTFTSHGGYVEIIK